jgi:hypothetical protein
MKETTTTIKLPNFCSAVPAEVDALVSLVLSDLSLLILFKFVGRVKFDQKNMNQRIHYSLLDKININKQKRIGPLNHVSPIA